MATINRHEIEKTMKSLKPLSIYYCIGIIWVLFCPDSQKISTMRHYTLQWMDVRMKLMLFYGISKKNNLLSYVPI